MKKHKKYQDYVIKNGKLIGEFEEMYKDFDDPGSNQNGIFIHQRKQFA